MPLRDLTTLDDYRAVVALEKRIWGYIDAEDIVPVPILAVTVKRGGILIGAVDDERQMVGFVYSLPGVKDDRPTQWSHMLGVLDSHRNAGVGRRLKLAQRQRAIDMGIDLVEWTYDPLQAVNAHLNFSGLGVVVGVYEENLYGESSSPLHRGTPTDRFVAEWWIRTPRVEQLVAPGGSTERDVGRVDEAVPVNRTRLSGAWLECVGHDLSLSGPTLSVDIPMRFSDMLVEHPDLARAWRLATRAIFTTYFRRGYRAVDFALDRERGAGRYLLARSEA